MVADRSGAPIAVVTVHGTGDTAATGEGEKWFQNGSDFAGRLKQGLAARGVDAEIFPHLWSGANSAVAREQGAEKLARLVRRLAKTHASVHVIGHSHGGNVANDAACMLNWSRKQRSPKLASVTTVGTPFFRTQTTRGERLGGWAFVVLVVLSVLFMALVALSTQFFLSSDSTIKAIELERARLDLAAAQTGNAPPERVAELEAAVKQQELDFAENDGLNSIVSQLVSGATILSVIALIVAFPYALRGVRRLGRAGRKRREDLQFHSIWHANDEAIAFLQRVEKLNLEPFPRWSLLRGARTGGILWGVRVALAIPAVGALLIIVSLAADLVGAPIRFLEDSDPGPEVFYSATSLAEIGTNVLLVGLAGAALVFLIVQFLYVAIVAVVMEFALRGRLNRMIGGTLHGMAFGRDGDIRVGEVASCSHYYGARRVVLEGELAERMLARSSDATRALFDKYRAGLFNVDADAGNAVAQLANDAMTWDSLIHTTYFDQPEMAEMIADYIAAEARPAPV